MCFASSSPTGNIRLTDGECLKARKGGRGRQEQAFPIAYACAVRGSSGGMRGRPPAVLTPLPLTPRWPQGLTTTDVHYYLAFLLHGQDTLAVAFQVRAPRSGLWLGDGGGKERRSTSGATVNQR